MSELGQRIRRARQTRGVTGAQLAERIGVSANYISELERGVKKNPSMQVVAGMAEVLNYPVDYFFGVEERRIRHYIPQDLNSYVQESVVAKYGPSSADLSDLNDHQLMDALVGYLRSRKKNESEE